MKEFLLFLALLVLAYAAYLGWPVFRAKLKSWWRKVRERAAWLREGKEIDDKMGE